MEQTYMDIKLFIENLIDCFDVVSNKLHYENFLNTYEHDTYLKLTSIVLCVCVNCI